MTPPPHPLRAVRLARPVRRGAALAASVVVVLTISMLVLILLTASVDNSKREDSRDEQFQLKAASESAVQLAAHHLWSRFLQLRMGEPGSLTEFRAYLDSLGIADSGAGAGAPDAAFTDVLSLAGFADDPDHREPLEGVVLEELGVSRGDHDGGTRIFVRATTADVRGALAGERRRESAQWAFAVDGGEWEGLEYVLLANNVNCIMCHARIDSADRFYNEDPALYGTFDRVKVGTLEELLLRSKADSTIAGTLHLSGRAINKKGDPITNWAAQTLKSLLFDSEGKVVEDAWGDPSLADLVPAPIGEALHNLYLDYGSDELGMVDGHLPEVFPPAFPDNGGTGPDADDALANNRLVDPSEFLAVAETAGGSLTGGTISVVPHGGTAIPGPDGEFAPNADSLASSTEGHVVLVGTEENPIVLDGTIAIHGDAILKGYVKGEGSLYVSGNVYVPSDLQYLDGVDEFGARTFGVGSDGTENFLSLASGGSVMIGDPFTGKKGPASGDESGLFNFVLSELALFNRGEWMRTQPMLPGPGEDIASPETWTAVNPNYMGPDYVPRYYSLTDGGTIPIYNQEGHYDPASGSWVGNEHSSKWKKGNTLAHPGDPTDPILYGPDGESIAAIHALTSMDGWFPEETLRSYMTAGTEDRSTGPLHVDAVLYSNNSIFGLVPRKSTMRGQMILNGAILAADVGLLVPGRKGQGGLFLNYDSRTSGALVLDGDGGAMTMRREHAAASPAAR